MRVLYLVPRPRSSGALSRYSFLDEEIRALAGAGIDVYVLSWSNSRDVDDGRIHIRAIPPDSVGDRVRTLRFLARHVNHVPLANLLHVPQLFRSGGIERRVAEIVKREGIALIHSYFAWPHGFGGLVARAATGVPLIAALRGADVNMLPSIGYGARRDPFFRRALRRLLRSADRTVYVSEFLQRQAITLGARPERATVILKGVRLDLFTVPRNRNAARSSIGAPAAPVILAVAGLVPIKGLNYILDALAAVRAAGRRFFLYVCGDGPQQDELEAQVARLSLEDCVHLVGRVPRASIAHYFAAADLFVHASLIEASGNVLLEAMASGLPIVCTDAGGPAEYVQDGVTGFVVPVADVAAMADRIIRLLDDVELRHRFGTLGRQRVELAFGYQRMIQETLTLYESCRRGIACSVDGQEMTRAGHSHA